MYFDAFPGLKDYFAFRRRDVFDKGYIDVGDGYGTKVRIPEIENAEDRYHAVPLWKARSIERTSLNYPTQGRWPW